MRNATVVSVFGLSCQRGVGAFDAYGLATISRRIELRRQPHTFSCRAQQYVMEPSGAKEENREFQLVINGEVMFDETIELPPDADMVEGIMKPPQQLAVVELEAGQDVPVQLTYRPTGGAAALGGAEVTMLTVQLNVAPVIDEQAEVDRAASLAAESDVAVVVVGTNEEVESEGFDRTGLALPGRQDELVLGGRRRQSPYGRSGELRRTRASAMGG